MGQNCSRKTTRVDFSEDEWETPNTEDSQTSNKKVKKDLTDDIDELEEHMKAQRDVLALLESQLSVLVRDEELLKQSVKYHDNEDDDSNRRSKLRRKRRRNLTYYRSSELLTC